jgi:hypothetical protein
VFPDVSRPTNDGDIPAFDFVPGSAPDDETTGVDTTYAPPSRRQKNPTVEIAKIVAGGLLALPLAQLILWWLPGKWQRDPLELGPDVGRVIPWVVPANYRPVGEADSSSTSPDPDQRVSRKSNAAKQTDQGKATRNGQEVPGPTARAGTRSSAEDDSSQKKTNGKRKPNNSLRNGKQNRSASADKAPEATSRVLLGVKNAPTYSAEQIHEILEQAIQANVAWDFSVDVTEQTMAQTTDQFYEAFAQLGHTVTFADTSSGDIRSYVQTLLNLLTAFGDQPKKLAMIGNRGAEWLRQNDRPNDGALLFGTVKQIRYRGLLYETTVDLAARGDDRTVMVVSTRDPKPAFSINSRVLILGAVVTNPRATMVGYRGDEPQVVVAGFPVPLSEAQQK